MASYHLSVQIVKRSEGRSVIAMAAYRSGSKLEDARSGRAHDYARRRGVVHQEILAPDGAPDWMSSREALWNAIDAMELRRDAQLAREINIALPAELDAGARLELARQFAREQFVSRGMVVDLALHDPVPERGDSPRNFHAHLLITMRAAVRSGFSRTKTRAWNTTSMLQAWRASWARLQNEMLARFHHRTRVDHRTLEAQRASALQRKDWPMSLILDRKPETHVGPQTRAIASSYRGSVRRSAKSIWIVKVDGRGVKPTRPTKSRGLQLRRAWQGRGVKAPRPMARRPRSRHVARLLRTLAHNASRQREHLRSVLRITAILRIQLSRRRGRDWIAALIKLLDALVPLLRATRNNTLKREREVGGWLARGRPPRGWLAELSRL